MKTKMATDLKQQWEKLCVNYTSDPALIHQLWEELEKAYTSDGRYYHTLDHLSYMLELADKYRQQDVKYNLLQFAVFYHDIIYTSSRSDNEEKSAELAEDRLKAIGLSATDTAFVKEMIMATKAHQPHQDFTTNFLLDLDLAILGAGWQKYNVYRQAIRKEYSIYPDPVYQSGRRKVLQHFLGMPHIFKTPLFQERLELQARENLRMELDMMGS